MELVVQASTKDLKEYKNASAFLFGLENFSYIMPLVVSIKELRNLKELYRDKKLFLAIDKNIFNDDLEALESSLMDIDTIGIEGILFYDLAVLNLANKINLKTPLIWNQNFLVTNYETCNYYYNEGVKYGVLASVLTIDEISEIAKNTKMELFVNIFGYQLMAFSKRKLISNYFLHIGGDNKSNKHYMIEKDKKYCILETNEGTKILSDQVLNGISEINKLKDFNVSYLILNSENIEHKIFLKILDIYQEALKFSSLDILDNQIKELIPNSSKIFLDRKTVYKVKKAWKE